MNLLIVPVPIFSKGIAVEAYMFRYQKGNDILEGDVGQGRFDGVMQSAPLEMLKAVSIETFTMGKPIFVPVTSFMLLANLEQQCSQSADKIVFLLDGTVKTSDEYLEEINRLKGLGYRFALQNIIEFEPYQSVLQLCDFILYDHRFVDTKEQQFLRIMAGRSFPKLCEVYTHVESMEGYLDASSKVSGWYEGNFYRKPLTKGKFDVTPLQVNLINLLNIVRDEDFEFSNVSGVIAKDPALSVALLKLVNSAYFGSRSKINNINHAVTMLGQKEVRKWITTAVSKLLGSDKPNEITRLSLIRARFAECLAEKFGLKNESDGLFLMGLFSVLDAILEKPMAAALELVHVSDNISDALVRGTGAYAPVYEFMQLYEGANWTALSRVMILRELSSSDIYDAYLDALCWYRDIISDGE